MLADGLVAVADGQHDALEAGVDQAVQDPGQERPARHRGHRLGQVGDDAAQPGAQAAGQHDGLHQRAGARAERSLAR